MSAFHRPQLVLLSDSAAVRFSGIEIGIVGVHVPKNEIEQRFNFIVR